MNDTRQLSYGRQGRTRSVAPKLPVSTFLPAARRALIMMRNDVTDTSTLSRQIGLILAQVNALELPKGDDDLRDAIASARFALSIAADIAVT